MGVEVVAMASAMTVEEAAQLLRVRPRTVRTWIKSGKIRASRIGKSYLIDERELQRALNQPGQQAAPNRRESIRRMRGVLVGTGFSTEAYMADKRRDAERENRSMAGDAGG